MKKKRNSSTKAAKGDGGMKFWRVLRHIGLGANMVIALALVLCGYSDCIHPEGWRWLVPYGLTMPFHIVTNLVCIVVWLPFKWRYALISLAALVVCFGPIRTYCPLNFPDPHPKGCIKVMSYNVQMFPAAAGDGTMGRTQLLEYIRAADADILCLQEYVVEPEGVDQTLSHWRYRETGDLGECNKIHICSRYPIFKIDTVIRDFHGHGSMAYWIKYGRDTLVVINNHFVSNMISSEDKDMYKTLVKTPSEAADTSVIYLMDKLGQAGVFRAEQADSLAAYLDRLAYPVVVCGDFNDSPISYPQRQMRRRLTDCYVASGNGPGTSYNQAGMYFRLDNIFCSDHFKPYEANVDNTITASDHYPIYCYLKYKN